jgi:hypothetical protein
MKHPAYHLRTNKAVDRLEWISQIKKTVLNERKAGYYSLSGPFLEDMKIAHYFFPRMQLVSIEGNAQTFKRQQFHKFSSKLRLQNFTLEDYLTHKYEPGYQDFFWLDFTDLSTESFRAFRTLLTKAPHGSLIRLTVRAEPSRVLNETRGHLTDIQQAEVRQRIETKFDQDFGAILSHDAPRTPLCSREEFARTVQLMARRIASEALDNKSERDFKHISTARYDDGSQMLSITGIVLDRDKSIAAEQRLRQNDLLLTDWPVPYEIEVPTLSLAERHTLNKCLPIANTKKMGTKLAGKLRYNIDQGVPRTEFALAQYGRHYLSYPSFLKVDF